MNSRQFPVDAKTDAGSRGATAPLTPPANGFHGPRPGVKPESAVPADRPGGAEEPARPPARPWVWKVALLLLVVAAAVGAVVGFRYYRFTATHVSTDAPI
jgi:hypothetical protein